MHVEHGEPQAVRQPRYWRPGGDQEHHEVDPGPRYVFDELYGLRNGIVQLTREGEDGDSASETDSLLVWRCYGKPTVWVTGQ